MHTASYVLVSEQCQCMHTASCGKLQAFLADHSTSAAPQPKPHTKPGSVSHSVTLSHTQSHSVTLSHTQSHSVTLHLACRHHPQPAKAPARQGSSPQPGSASRLSAIQPSQATQAQQQQRAPSPAHLAGLLKLAHRQPGCAQGLRQQAQDAATATVLLVWLHVLLIALGRPAQQAQAVAQMRHAACC
jgi:hypothetical protein